MKWAKGSLIGIMLLGISSLSSLHNVCYAAPMPGDIVVEIEPVFNRRSPPNLQSAKTSSPSVPSNFPTFNSQQLDRQLQLYLEYVDRHGPPDILIVGSSRALQGVDPIALQRSLAQQGYPTLKVFNFGINGATAQVVNWVLQRLLLPEQLPKLILWADGARAFNSGRFDHTFNKILQSKGQERLAAGIKPSSISNNLKVGQICMDFLPVALQARQSNSPMYYPIQKPASPTPSLRSPQELCRQPVKITVRNPEPPPRHADSPQALAESLGFQRIGLRFNPNAYFRQYPKVSGAYDADYRNFTLNGPQSVAFESLVKFVNLRKIPLVFINLPLTTTYLDFDRSFYETQFQSRMQRTARSKQIVFKNLLPHNKLRVDHYFADPSHLNQFGAAAVSIQISQEITDLLPKVFGRRPDQSQVQSSRFPILCKNACLLLPRLSTG